VLVQVLLIWCVCVYVLLIPLHFLQAPRVFDTVNGLGYTFGALGLGSPPSYGPTADSVGSEPKLYTVTETKMFACPGIPVTDHAVIHFELTDHAYHNGVMGPDHRIIGMQSAFVWIS